MKPAVTIIEGTNRSARRTWRETIFSEIESKTCAQSQIEKECLDLLLKIEEDFRSFHMFFAKEIRKQRTNMDEMECISTRYITQVCPTKVCLCKLPDSQRIQQETDIAKDFFDLYQTIEESNDAIREAIQGIRPIYLKFRRTTARLDMSNETDFIMGDAYHAPIAYFMELVDDIFKYFHAVNIKMDNQAHLLDILNTSTISDYNKLLAKDEEFKEQLFMRLTYCSCLQPKLHCPGKRNDAHLTPCELLRRNAEHTSTERFHKYHKMARACMERKETRFRELISLGSTLQAFYRNAVVNKRSTVSLQKRSTFLTKNMPTYF